MTHSSLNQISTAPAMSAAPAFDVRIEIAAGGEPIKYELDKATAQLRVDRFLHTAMRYPCNYGFIPETLSRDGDPCDVLVIAPAPIVPGAVVRCRALAVLLMEDEHGPDEKILAVPVRTLTPDYDDVHDLDDVPRSRIELIEHFFAHYKDLEVGKWVRIDRWGSSREAATMVEEAQNRGLPAMS